MAQRHGHSVRASEPGWMDLTLEHPEQFSKPTREHRNVWYLLCGLDIFYLSTVLQGAAGWKQPMDSTERWPGSCSCSAVTQECLTWKPLVSRANSQYTTRQWDQAIFWFSLLWWCVHRLSRFTLSCISVAVVQYLLASGSTQLAQFHWWWQSSADALLPTAKQRFSTQV